MNVFLLVCTPALSLVFFLPLYVSLCSRVKRVRRRDFLFFLWFCSFSSPVFPFLRSLFCFSLSPSLFFPSSSPFSFPLSALSHPSLSCTKPTRNHHKHKNAAKQRKLLFHPQKKPSLCREETQRARNVFSCEEALHPQTNTQKNLGFSFLGFSVPLVFLCCFVVSLSTTSLQKSIKAHKNNTRNQTEAQRGDDFSL